MNVLVTGGAGYIGSHTVVELLNANNNVIVIDNLSNSNSEVFNRIKRITNKDVKFYKIDCRDEKKVDEVFKKNKIDSVIHFAGFKAVGESGKVPLSYYDNNINSLLTILRCMQKHDVFTIVFSSSACVYGYPKELPLNENSPLEAINTYGRTKLYCENILKDLYTSDNRFNVVLLRYFNPIGAHKSGLIGEDPRGIPNNLMPYISQVSVGKLDKLHVFGNDYDTKDGTCIRDYIHVVDLARGHLQALNMVKTPGVHIYNLGTGNGYSVMEVIEAYEKASGVKIPYVIDPRRQGDAPSCFTSNSKALAELNFKTEYDINDMCVDQFNWQSKNPKGYSK